MRETSLDEKASVTILEVRWSELQQSLVVLILFGLLFLGGVIMTIKQQNKIMDTVTTICAPQRATQ